VIAQLLNRDFVINQMEVLQVELERIARGENAISSVAPSKLSKEDLIEAALSIKNSLIAEKSQSSGQPGYEPPPAERRNLLQRPPPLDDYVFMSRDKIVSITQSILDEYFHIHPQGKTLLETKELSDDDRRSRGDDLAITDSSIRGVSLKDRRRANGRRLFDKFSTLDAGWVSSKVAEAIRLARKKYPFNGTPAESLTISNRARIILLGDWGTGIPRAQKVAKMIEKILAEGSGKQLEQHVIHLGDVYYSGWKREYEDRFLKYWPVRPEEADKYSSWSLNGNHDMFSGGHAYYTVLLNDERFKRQQRSSFFSLSNRYWKILGLDSAWEDDDLKDPQASWVESNVQNTSQKIMLLSHHQLFSAYEGGREKMQKKLASILQSGRIRTWFWGHEHRCVIYNPNMNVQFARCVGHGGVPVYMNHSQKDEHKNPAQYEYRAFIQMGIEKWALFGFVVLDFDNDTISVKYVNENGVVHKEESIR